MKLIFISDIHGSYKYAKEALKVFNKEQGDYLVILGDILYHGPRNPLPEEYNPQEVANIFNNIKEKIIAVRGNCDSEVDQMVLDFPCMSDYSILFLEGKRVFLTHGHLYNKENLPKLSKGDILIHGHTHIQEKIIHQGITILNPGSISYPKNNTPHSYGIYEDGFFEIKDLAGNLLNKTELK